MEHSVLLFVYGTLMREEANAGYLGEAVFLGVSVTAPGYELVDLGPFPAMATGGTGVVSGELYRLAQHQLPRLDEFEGHPEDYLRQEVVLEDGRKAQAYLGTARVLRGMPRIVSGNWRLRHQ